MRSAVIAVVLALTAALAGGTAHADEWNYAHDGYEGAYWDRWEFPPEGAGTGEVESDQGTAFRGSNNGWVHAREGNWAAQRRAFDVSGWNRTNCYARMWANPLEYAAPVGLQVWNPNGWTLIADRAPALPAGSYSQIVVGPFDMSNTGSVYLQGIYGDNTSWGQYVRLDEFELECF